jgi:hypothetical protein
MVVGAANSGAYVVSSRGCELASWKSSSREILAFCSTQVGDTPGRRAALPLSQSSPSIP